MVKIAETRKSLSGSWVHVGAHTYGTPRIVGGGPGSRLEIGKFCSIAPGVELELAGDHHLDRASMYPFDNIDAWGSRKELRPYRRPNQIIVGNDVWLGAGCRLLHGVTVGDGAAVGAYAVVSRDVRPYAVVVGNPAREIARRFADEEIERLLTLEWWNWPEEKIKENAAALSSSLAEGGLLDEGCGTDRAC